MLPAYEALAIVDQLLASPEHLVVRCRRLLGLLRALQVDLDRDELQVFRAVDSEADRWPLGVDCAWLDAAYWHRSQSEMQDYAREVWDAVRAGCRVVRPLLAV